MPGGSKKSFPRILGYAKRYEKKRIQGALDKGGLSPLEQGQSSEKRKL
jgi:hypothetical protein